uniref:Uncharacterized protein n=1 Tax=Rhipicephalus zambeziensis TaxID=60191 RepID=A0A224YGA7_9ACAR
MKSYPWATLCSMDEEDWTDASKGHGDCFSKWCVCAAHSTVILAKWYHCDLLYDLASLFWLSKKKKKCYNAIGRNTKQQRKRASAKCSRSGLALLFSLLFRRHLLESMARLSETTPMLSSVRRLGDAIALVATGLR